MIRILREVAESTLRDRTFKQGHGKKSQIQVAVVALVVGRATTNDCFGLFLLARRAGPLSKRA